MRSSTIFASLALLAITGVAGAQGTPEDHVACVRGGHRRQDGRPRRHHRARREQVAPSASPQCLEHCDGRDEVATRRRQAEPDGHPKATTKKP